MRLLRATDTSLIRETKILRDCYAQLEQQIEQNNFHFDIKLQRTVQGSIELRSSDIEKGRHWVAREKIPAGRTVLIEKATVYSSRKQHPFWNQFRNSRRDKTDVECDETKTESPKENTTSRFVQASTQRIDLMPGMPTSCIPVPSNAMEPQFDETALLMAQSITDLRTFRKLKYLYPRVHEMAELGPFDLEEHGIESDHDQWLYSTVISTKLDESDKSTLERLPWIALMNAQQIAQNVEQLCYFTTFSPHGNGKLCDEANDDEKYDGTSHGQKYQVSYCEMEGDGLFVKGSYFNHCCTPNVTRYYIGDIMVVRSIRDIEAGEEVCFSYIESEYLSEPEPSRADKLPFECLCERCLSERKECETESEDENSDGDSDEESEDEADDQIFNESQCEELMMMSDVTERIKAIDLLLATDDINYVDKLQGFTARALAYLELRMFIKAGCCWTECLTLTQDALGWPHENLVPYYIQIIMSKMTELLQKTNGQENVPFDLGIAARQSEEIMQMVHAMIRCFNICFGGGAICFMMRYNKELTLSSRRYPDIVRDCDRTWNLLLNHNGK